MKSLLLTEDIESDITVGVGKKAPDFILKDEKDTNWQLSDQLGSVTVLLFYPQNETLVCNRQLCSVRDSWESYLKTKAFVVGISPAAPEQQREFGKKLRLPFTLLSDPNRKITRLFTEHWLYPVQFMRGVIVVDAKGVIRNRNTMLRVFRPFDHDVITAIHESRGDALSEEYDKIRKSFRRQRFL